MGRREQPHGFDLLRIVAAALVVVNHSYLIPTGRTPRPLVFDDYAFDWGRVGVIVFFVLSGYLVCGSWLSRPDLRVFAAKRARRIYPGLVLMLVLTTFVLGPLVTSSKAYFAESGTWVYLVRNLFVVPYDYVLPGVFHGDPVNAVLWTLGLEVLAYGMIATLGLLRLLRPSVLLAVTIVLTLAGWPWLMHMGPSSLDPISTRLNLVAFFAAGAFVRASGRTPRPTAAVAGVVVVAAAAASGLPLSAVTVPALTVVVLYLGTRAARWASAFVRLGDPSYGIYIYGFVIQQLLMHNGLRDAPRGEFITLSLALSFVAGYTSWHLWERHFLRTSRAVPDAPRRRAEPRATPR